MQGQKLTVAVGKKAAAGDILFTYKPQKALGNEGYTTDIGKNVRIEATEHGALHAVQTLLQIGSPLPCGKITDHPDYRLRGLMLD